MYGLSCKPSFHILLSDQCMGTDIDNSVISVVAGGRSNVMRRSLTATGISCIAIKKSGLKLLFHCRVYGGFLVMFFCHRNIAFPNTVMELPTGLVLLLESSAL